MLAAAIGTAAAPRVLHQYEDGLGGSEALPFMTDR